MERAMIAMIHDIVFQVLLVTGRVESCPGAVCRFIVSIRLLLGKVDLLDNRFLTTRRVSRGAIEIGLKYRTVND